MRASESSGDQYEQMGYYTSSLLHSAMLQVANQLVDDGTHDMTSLLIVFAIRHLSRRERASRG